MLTPLYSISIDKDRPAGFVSCDLFHRQALQLPDAAALGDQISNPELTKKIMKSLGELLSQRVENEVPPGQAGAVFQWVRNALLSHAPTSPPAKQPQPQVSETTHFVERTDDLFFTDEPETWEHVKNMLGHLRAAKEEEELGFEELAHDQKELKKRELHLAQSVAKDAGKTLKEAYIEGNATANFSFVIHMTDGSSVSFRYYFSDIENIGFTARALTETDAIILLDAAKNNFKRLIAEQKKWAQIQNLTLQRVQTKPYKMAHLNANRPTLDTFEYLQELYTENMTRISDLWDYELEAAVELAVGIELRLHFESSDPDKKIIGTSKTYAEVYDNVGLLVDLAMRWLINKSFKSYVPKGVPPGLVFPLPFLDAPNRNARDFSESLNTRSA